MTYQECWGNILSRHVAFRCRLCPDSTGEFADISCGDPWYRNIEPGDPGRSLVIARNEKGADIVRRAIAAGYLVLEPVKSEVIALSQKSLLNKRRHLWARLKTMAVLGFPFPGMQDLTCTQAGKSCLSRKNLNPLPVHCGES